MTSDCSTPMMRPATCWSSNGVMPQRSPATDRKSTRLNSSHANISYAVFCLKKKKIQLVHVPRNSGVNGFQSVVYVPMVVQNLVSGMVLVVSSVTDKGAGKSSGQAVVVHPEN